MIVLRILCFIAAFHEISPSQILADIDVLVEIEKLKRNDEIHQQLIEVLQSTVQKQAEHIDSLEFILEDQQKQIEILKATSDGTKTENPLMNKPLPTSGTDIIPTLNFTNQAKHRVNKRQTSEGPVAFHALINIGEIMHIGIGQNIVFENELLNVGNGYHKIHGLFIAPRAGIYCFSMTIATTTDIEVYMSKTGSIIASVVAYHGSAYFEQGSATGIVQLAVGDEVWVHSGGPADATLHGNTFSSFSGFLIHAL